ncbi:hypothetical protein DENSPDRAFT_886736 [Dentipellis sp. KUC8613]|nr:hypothetical protein DENSPDRAFT_886736 [Dentipellis sp. KUC8613]
MPSLSHAVSHPSCAPPHRLHELLRRVGHLVLGPAVCLLPRAVFAPRPALACHRAPRATIVRPRRPCAALTRSQAPQRRHLVVRGPMSHLHPLAPPPRASVQPACPLTAITLPLTAVMQPPCAPASLPPATPRNTISPCLGDFPGLLLPACSISGTCTRHLACRPAFLPQCAPSRAHTPHLAPHSLPLPPAVLLVIATPSSLPKPSPYRLTPIAWPLSLGHRPRAGTRPCRPLHPRRPPLPGRFAPHLAASAIYAPVRPRCTRTRRVAVPPSHSASPPSRAPAAPFTLCRPPYAVSRRRLSRRHLPSCAAPVPRS